MTEEEKNKRMNQYLAKEMPQEAIESFEKDLQTDPQLREELELEIATRASIFAAGVHEQKAQFRERYQQLKPIPIIQAQRRRRTLLFSSAAAVILLLLAFAFFDSNSPSNQDLYAMFYQQPKASVFRDTDGNASFKAAQIAYADGKFVEAAASYQSALQDSAFTAREEARFYLGISLMEQDELSRAIETFVLLNTSEDYRYMAEWYTALSYLQQGDQENAYTQLQDIIRDNDHFYLTQAQDLMKKMNKE